MCKCPAIGCCDTLAIDSKVLSQVTNSGITKVIETKGKINN
jgi:hypothetical protein